MEYVRIGRRFYGVSGTETVTRTVDGSLGKLERHVTVGKPPFYAVDNQLSTDGHLQMHGLPESSPAYAKVVKWVRDYRYGEKAPGNWYRSIRRHPSLRNCNRGKDDIPPLYPVTNRLVFNNISGKGANRKRVFTEEDVRKHIAASAVSASHNYN